MAASDWVKPENRILQNLMYNALNMSLSVRILSTYGQLLEGLVLVRSRLEQLSTSSYLIHSDDGFVLYADDLNRLTQRFTKNYQKDVSLKTTLDSIFSIVFPDSTKQSITDIFPDLSVDPGKLPQKWTNLDLYSMALKRDERIEEDHAFKSSKLGWSYVSLYHTASNIAHCYPPSITEYYLTKGPNGQPSPRWECMLLNLTNNALFDIIQNYEVVKYIKCVNDKSLIALKEEFAETMLGPL